MLFLCNTAARSIYLDNIFATLCLPYGTANIYQYTYTKKSNMVDDSAKNVSEDEDVLIIYIDKYSKRMQSYIPLRKGKLIKTETMDGRIYYNVKMLDYVHASNIEKFSSYICDRLKDKIYHTDEKEESHGFLAIKDEGIVGQQGYLCTTQESWINTVTTLSNRELFMKNYSLFIRFGFIDAKGNLVDTQNIDSTWGYNLTSSNTYYLSVSTYIKDYFADYPMKKLHLRLQDTNDLFGLQITEFEIGSGQTYLKTPIKIVDINKQRKTFFSISCDDEALKNGEINFNTKGCFVYANEGLKAYIKKTIILGCIILLAVATWVNTLPINSIINDISKEMANGSVSSYKSLLYNLCLLLDSAKYYYSAVTSAVITLATVGLIHYYGKPSLY